MEMSSNAANAAVDNTKQYVKEFFDKLQVFEDVQRGHMYKVFIKQAVLNFLDDENAENAWDVYRCFFDIYKISIDGSSDAFVDLLDVLRQYEENAAVLIDRQRDHYVHAVNVFILGLCIYSRNEKYQEAFDSYALDKKEYEFSYSTKHEEFFYRWGLASLFHDVGYPVEIVGKQINKYISFASDIDGDEEKVRVRLEYDGFDELNKIKELIPADDFSKAYSSIYKDTGTINLLCPIDLLAHRIHIVFGISLDSIKATLNSFVDTMGKLGFIDHGFFSSLIVLKWYGFLIQKAGYKSEYFYWPVLDAALAILLHNCYRNILQKPPYSLGTLDAKKNPLAFLLILCDELQEWNRTAYGIKDKLRVLPAQKCLSLEGSELDITYVTDGSCLPTGFASGKADLLKSILKLDSIFNSVQINCNFEGDELQRAKDTIPRPALAQLERLAEAIHELYNEKKLERNPLEPLKYPSFATLDDSLKYSNLRQARDIFNKASLMGYEIAPLDTIKDPVREFPKDMVEAMAKREHDLWVAEKLQQGVDSPYLVPYSELTDEIKQLDRDTIDNIPVLLEKIGLGLCKRS